MTRLRPTLINVGSDELPLLSRCLVNALWAQLYMWLTGAQSLDPIQAIMLSGIVSTMFAYWDGVVSGVASMDLSGL
jgi:hypothetical protein